MRHRDKDTLKRLYKDRGLSMSGVADELGCSPGTVMKWLHKHGIETEPSTRDKPPSLDVSTQGYERFRASFQEDDGKRSHDQVHHHRLLAAVDHSLAELEGRHVHHINEIPWDNRQSNLVVVDRKTHALLHEVPR